MVVWLRQQSSVFDDEDGEDGGGGSDGVRNQHEREQEDESGGAVASMSVRHRAADVISPDSGFDAESVLLSLGFTDVDPVKRIPHRFRSPSRLKGIDTSFLLCLLSSDPDTTTTLDPVSASRSLLRDRDPDQSLIRSRNAPCGPCLATASTQTQEQDWSGIAMHMELPADLSERETLLTIILRSLQLSLEYYCSLVSAFLQNASGDRSQEADDGQHAHHHDQKQTQSSPAPAEHLSLVSLTARISEEVSFIANHLSLQPEHLLFLCQDGVILRIRHLSRRVRTECSRLLHVAHLLHQQQRALSHIPSFTTSSSCSSQLLQKD